MSRRQPPLWMLLPFLVLFVGFVLWPIVRSSYLSFTNFDAVNPPRWVGFANYRGLLGDPVFIRALFNTVVYSVCVVGISTLLGLYLAFRLSAPTVLNVILRSVFFLPTVSGTIALISIFFYIFSSYRYGFLNQWLERLGLPQQAFFDDARWIMPVLVIIGVWTATGLAMVLFLAGLRNIPPELLEAAALDGATPFRRLTLIILPLLRPTMVYVVVSAGITTFQMFNESFLLRNQTNRVDALEAGQTLVVYLYNHGFERFDFGLASAVAWVLFLLVFALALANFRLAGQADEVGDGR